MFDRKIFFDVVRETLFGSLTQQQVEGMNFKLDQWEAHHVKEDMRWCSYCFATSYHETGKKMWPVEEVGHGGSALYARPDPVTGKQYYGRGDVQLSWANNYRRATKELGLTGENDLYLHPEKALDPKISADVMYKGMIVGWFRSTTGSPCNLPKYFNSEVDNAYEAREIVNGDKSIIPTWSHGVSIGHLIKGYHDKFYSAIKASWVAPPSVHPVVTVTIAANQQITLIVNGVEIKT